jgi:hypothetical protein
MTKEHEGAVLGTRFNAAVRYAMVWKITNYYQNAAQSLASDTTGHLLHWILASCVEIEHDQ